MARSSPKLLVYLWRLQDGQGRPPLHVALHAENMPVFDGYMLEKAFILTMSRFSVADATLRQIIRARDGGGRTAAHRIVARGRALLSFFDKIMENKRDIFQKSRSVDYFPPGGPISELAQRYKIDKVDERRMTVATRAFRDSLTDTTNLYHKRQWTSKGQTYEIDLFRLSEMNGFSENLWETYAPIHTALLHGHDVIWMNIIMDYTPEDFSPSPVKGWDTKTSNKRVGRQRTGQKEASSTTRWCSAIAFWRSPRWAFDNWRDQKEQFDSINNLIKKAQIRPKMRSLDPVSLAMFGCGAIKYWSNQIKLNKLAKHVQRHQWSRLSNSIPAICIAAAFGKYDMLQFLIECKFDPLETAPNGKTALHFATQGTDTSIETLYGVDLFSFVDCQHILEDLEKEKTKWEAEKVKLKDGLTTKKHLKEKEEILVERQGCINFLMQQGCEIFKKDGAGKVPYPSGDTSPEFLKWWHEKQLREFEAAQSGQSIAANAISVTAALVATASYVGPLQPPLGYGDDNMGLQLEIWAVRVFTVCDTLSFYLAIAAIICALGPCLSMPQQPMLKELRRTKRSVNAAVALLFPSIICVLLAFAAGSIAVIRTHQTSLTIVTTSIDGFICLIVILFFLIRVLALTFHRISIFTRLYGKSPL